MSESANKYARDTLQALRYGIDHALKKPMPMPDGYWVPWHIADQLIASLRESNDGQCK